jgi:NTE family protein
MKKMEIGLVLSGGAARAAAHIGVLKFLEEKGVRISAISGSSAGAIVALLMAASWKTEEMRELLHSLEKRDIFRFRGSPGIFSLERLERRLREALQIESYDELEIPCFCAVTDMQSAQVHYLSEGDPIRNVIASSALTPIFSPVSVEGRLFADGGFRDNLPARPLLKYNLPILGIDVNPLPKRGSAGVISLTIHTVMILLRGTTLPSRQLCDSYRMIDAVSDMPLFDFGRVNEAIEAAYSQMQREWDSIEESLLSSLKSDRVADARR